MFQRLSFVVGGRSLQDRLLLECTLRGSVRKDLMLFDSGLEILRLRARQKWGLLRESF